MTAERTHNPILWSTIVLALLLALTAVAGVWWPATYAKETLYQRSGGRASDLVDLFLVVPVLLISGIKGYRGSLAARLIWLGTLGYLFYNFVLYAFGVRFNPLFLVYCAILSLCVYAGVFSVPLIPLNQIAQTYSPRAPRKTAAITLLVFALVFALFDLSQIVPPMLAGQVPQSAVQAGTPVNFVHALDLTFLLPALCIAAALLLRRKPSGYALAPALLALLAIMNMEMAVLMVVMARMGVFGMSYAMTISFVVSGAFCAILLWFYLRFGAARADSKSSDAEFAHSR